MLKGRHLRQLVDFCRFATKFGLDTAIGYILMPYLKGRNGLPAKHQAVKKYLTRWSKKYLVDSASLEIPYSKKKIERINPIWVCWLQGESNMPESIRLCYQSVLRNSASREVILLTFDSISEYIDIPQSIQTKLNSKEITYTHFADYLRIALLKNYGGIWVDASIYITSPIASKIEDNAIFTPKLYKRSNAFVSDSRWTVSLLGCTANNKLFVALELLMRKYIEDHNQFIDFFLFDYLISILYDKYQEIARLIDSNEYNNVDLYKLESIANEPFDEEHWDMLIKNQCFHKLSWKSTYILPKEGEPETYYSHIRNCQ